jgi:hypothetical protein
VRLVDNQAEDLDPGRCLQLTPLADVEPAHYASRDLGDEYGVISSPDNRRQPVADIVARGRIAQLATKFRDSINVRSCNWPNERRLVVVPYAVEVHACQSAVKDAVSKRGAIGGSDR